MTSSSIIEIARWDIFGWYSVVWNYDKQTGLHHIMYGAEVRRTYNGLEASEHYGHFIRHAAEANGLFFDEEPNYG